MERHRLKHRLKHRPKHRLNLPDSPYPHHLIMFDPPITTTGTVIDSPKENIYQVALPNGKIIVGHVAKAMIALHEQIKPDSKVKLELTPYDLSKGRIVAVESGSDTIK